MRPATSLDVQGIVGPRDESHSSQVIEHGHSLSLNVAEVVDAYA